MEKDEYTTTRLRPIVAPNNGIPAESMHLKKRKTFLQPEKYDNCFIGLSSSNFRQISGRGKI